MVGIEVDRPDRRMRRNKGKSDTIDAESAARNVLSGETTAIPKAQDATSRHPHSAAHPSFRRHGARAGVHQIHALIATAPTTT